MKLKKTISRLTASLLLMTVCLVCHAEVADSTAMSDRENFQVFGDIPFKSIQKADSSYVQFSHDSLIFPADHHCFDSLYYKLKQLHDGADTHLNILHIGGSHVQAGIFPARMRSNLQAFCPTGMVAEGMMFPFSALGTNRPKGYTCTVTGSWDKSRNTEKSPRLTMGLSGAAIATKNLSSTITLKRNQPFESLLVYGENLIDTAWVYPILVTECDTIYPPRTSETTEYEFLLPNPVQECTIAFQGDSCGSFSFRGAIASPYSPGLIYSASGINGAAVPSWLRCSAFQEELQSIAPDLAVLAIGINDANVQNFSAETFKQNYRLLIAQIKAANPHCALLFLTNNDCYLSIGRRRRTINKNTSLAEQAFLELAKEYNGAVWNLYRIMGGQGSSNKWVKGRLMQSDHIHFTERGYNLLGDLLYNALLNDYKQYLHTKSIIPFNPPA